MILNQELLDWVQEIETHCQPNQVIWWNGTKTEYDSLLEEQVNLGKAIALNQEKRPGCYLFRTDPSDVARVENRTFISTEKESNCGPTNNWISPLTLQPLMWNLFKNAMVGRTMYVIPFSMGPIHSPYARFGVEITDSPYVVLNMHIMTRTGNEVLERIHQGSSFVKCLHSVGFPLENEKQDVLWPCAPIEQKYIAHFPEQNLIWSYGSGYGGNALLGKKCFALRIASYLANKEGWLAEHMLILKVTSPDNRVKYITGAFPSACGKTNLAMISPTLEGWKAETLGDDIAWMHFSKDGKLHAINPEYGFFGVAHGTSYQTNPNAMETISHDTLFTNVALTDDGDVWWDGMTKDIPAHLIDWEGNDWFKGDDKKPAHPNSRFTSPILNCPTISNEVEDPDGVPISAILFGGRRPTTIPLIHESFDFNHGVFLGSIMGSEITAATISNQIGKVRRDPFAMRPFIGYHIKDYIKHWVDMGRKTQPENLPKIFYVNWFLKDNNHFLWPGFGDNIRIIKWIFDRIDFIKDARTSKIGYLPYMEDIDLSGLDMDKNTLAKLFEIDSSLWKEEIKSIEEFYEMFEDELPLELQNQLHRLHHNFYQ